MFYRETSPMACGLGAQLVTGAFKLCFVLKPLQKRLVQASIVIDRVQIVGEGVEGSEEIAGGQLRHLSRNRRAFCDFLDGESR